MDTIVQNIAAKSEVSDLQQWKETVFKPWTQQIEQSKIEQKEYVQKIKAHSGSLKHMIALLCENRGQEVVAIWNNLELHPILEAISINYDTSEVLMKANDGAEESLHFDDLIEGIKTILEA